ncbi:MAG: hypothetical protein QOD71_16 [Thermoleophilaceae bacterium]|jgi:hypothetical protein|nr:hypothetical protein [Thermoleophilaceae bacterium]
MTALQAAGGGIPLALHIPHVVEQVGSIAGFAAVLGLAVLSALYFSQARDLRRLREWAGRAPERAAETGAAVQPVPGRVVAVPQRAPQVVQAPGTTAGAAAAPATTAQPAGANGSPGVEVTKAPEGDDAKVGAVDGEKAAAATGEDAAKPGDVKDESAESKDAAKPGEDGVDGAKPDPAQPGTTPGPAKPGMPAPASAAAAAGAGAASVSGPPAPGAGTPSPATPRTAGAAGAAAAAAPPQRPPGSVLPPRTGTLPPVRRLPSSNVGRPGAPPASVLGSTPEPKRRRNPVYVVLAIAGVLILGAGAAIGVPKLVNGAKNDNNASKTGAKTKSTKTTKKAAPVKPGKITVAVLNGTGIPGLAAQIADRVDAVGFTRGTVSNASQTGGQRVNSVAMYASGHKSDASAVARKLRIKTVQPIDAESQGIAGDASVVVIVGSDKTQ